MTVKDINTEIALLKQERAQMAKDITDLKEDVRQIKDFLMGEDPKVVTKKEFEAYRTSNTLSRWIVGIVTSVLTAFITYEVLRQLGNK